MPIVGHGLGLIFNFKGIMTPKQNYELLVLKNDIHEQQKLFEEFAKNDDDLKGLFEDHKMTQKTNDGLMYISYIAQQFFKIWCGGAGLEVRI